MGNTLKSRIQKIEKLPTLPEIAHQILSLTNDPLLSVDELKNIVERDPAISAKILSVANSAFFGLSVQTNMLYINRWAFVLSQAGIQYSAFYA